MENLLDRRWVEGNYSIALGCCARAGDRAGIRCGNYRAGLVGRRRNFGRKRAGGQTRGDLFHMRRATGFIMSSFEN